MDVDEGAVDDDLRSEYVGQVEMQQVHELGRVELGAQERDSPLVGQHAQLRKQAHASRQYNAGHIELVEDFQCLEPASRR